MNTVAPLAPANQETDSMSLHPSVHSAATSNPVPASVVAMRASSGIARRHRAAFAMALGVLAVAVALMGLATGVRAGTIGPVVNVNFKPNGTVNSLNGTAWTASVAPLSYTGNVWRDTAGVTSATSLPYSDGTPSLVGFTVDSFSWTDGWTHTPTMLKGGGYYGTGSPRDPNASRVLTITGLENTTRYDLYIAGVWLQQENGFIATVGSTSLTNAGTQGSSWVEGSNYVHFADLYPVGGQIRVTLNPDVDNGGGVSQYIILSGFQLGTVVPEPATAVIAALGLGGLCLRRRRK